MRALDNGTVKIRRSWTEDGISLGIGLLAALYVVFVLDKPWLAPLYVPWTLTFLSMNRHMGIDLTPTTAVVRTMFWRSRTVRREDITDVAIVKVGSASHVGLHVQGAKRPVKVTIKTAFGPWGNRRLAGMHAQIRQWWLDAPAAPVPAAAQMPGSASI